MKVSELVRVDSKGRVLLPRSIRDATGIREGMHVLLTADAERREILISSLAAEAELARFYIQMSDVPGSLAKIAGALADANIDLLATESRTLRRGELAEWNVVADVSRRTLDLESVEKALLKTGAKAVRVELLRG